MLRHQIDFLVQSCGARVRTQVADDDFYIQTSDGSKYGNSCEPNVKGGNGWEAALPNELGISSAGGTIEQSHV